MNAQRYLMMKSVIFAIPDTFKPGEQVTIDEALQLLLDYRRTAHAVTENNAAGNFTYMASDYPEVTNPDMPNFTPETLLDFVQNSASKSFGGFMATVIYDPELNALRNCYNEQELAQFMERKQFLLASNKAMMEGVERATGENLAQSCVEIMKGEAVAPPEPQESCNECINICQEVCPDEPAVEEKMQESDDV